MSGNLVDIKSMIGRQPIPQQQQMNIKLNLDEMPEVKCLICDCNEFIEVVKMKYVSKIQSPVGKESWASTKKLVCKKCDAHMDLNEWMRKTILKEEPQEENP